MLLKALYFLVLVGAFHGVTAGVNSTNPTHNSTNSACKGHMPGCRKLIRVSWNERRPYVYQVGNETRGILPGMQFDVLSTTSAISLCRYSLCMSVYFSM